MLPSFRLCISVSPCLKGMPGRSSRGSNPGFANSLMMSLRVGSPTPNVGYGFRVTQVIILFQALATA